MISEDYVVEQLCRMMGNEKGTYGIEWSLDPGVGYRAIVHGVGLYLREYYIPDRTLYLFVFNDTAMAQIKEPLMHLSCAPIGKLLRTATSFLSMEPWPKLPETSEAEANERLRIGLNKLHARASEQDDLRSADSQLSQDLRAAIEKGMFRQNFFELPQDNEGVRQQLFRDLLRLKPATQ